MFRWMSESPLRNAPFHRFIYKKRGCDNYKLPKQRLLLNTGLLIACYLPAVSYRSYMTNTFLFCCRYFSSLSFLLLTPSKSACSSSSYGSVVTTRRKQQSLSVHWHMLDIRTASAKQTRITSENWHSFSSSFFPFLYWEKCSSCHSISSSW